MSEQQLSGLERLIQSLKCTYNRADFEPAANYQRTQWASLSHNTKDLGGYGFLVFMFFS